MVEGAQAVDVEDDVLPVVMKVNESAAEKEQAPTLSEAVESDTIVIEKMKGVSKPPSLLPPRQRCSSVDLARGPCPSLAASSIFEVESVTGVFRQSLTTDTAHTLASMLARTADVLGTWPGSSRGVPLL